MPRRRCWIAYRPTSWACSTLLHDHVASEHTQNAEGVDYLGTAAPDAVSASDYLALGLSAAESAALRRVSANEGRFDAVHTYDRAAVSVGFIQFAGGRGLGRYLALLKLRQPVKFRDLFQRYGLDVELSVNARGDIDWAQVVVMDPGAARVLRGPAAEAAIRDDKRLTAVLIRSGRDGDVQRVQIEAAIRDYAAPALAWRARWAPRAAAPLRSLLRSRTGLAALFDRAIQEGVRAAGARFDRVIGALNAARQRAGDGSEPPPLTLEDLQRREGDILAELERDLSAATSTADAIARARDALAALAVRPAGATLDGELRRPELATARRALADARAELQNVVNVSAPRGMTIAETITAMASEIDTAITGMSLEPAPASFAQLDGTLARARDAVATVAGPLATARTFLRRVQSIRRSMLDATLTESFETLNLTPAEVRPAALEGGEGPMVRQ